MHLFTGGSEIDDGYELKCSIIDLYCAIKIRSTEELEKITDKELAEEKIKLLNLSGLTVLDYIRSSIEVIMSLRVEDLEAEFNKRNLFERDSDSQDDASILLSLIHI